MRGPMNLHPTLLQADKLLYAEVKNTARFHDKKKISEYRPNFEDSANAHARRCFKDYYPDENIELATPNKYSSNFCMAGLKIGY